MQNLIFQIFDKVAKKVIQKNICTSRNLSKTSFMPKYFLEVKFSSAYGSWFSFIKKFEIGVSMKEKPRRRRTVTSSFNEISMDQLGNGLVVRWGEV